MREIEQACRNCNKWGLSYGGSAHLHPSVTNVNVCMHYTENGGDNLLVVPADYWCERFERAGEGTRDE